VLNPTDVAITTIPQEMIVTRDRKLEKRIPGAHSCRRTEGKVVTAKRGQPKTVVNPPQTSCLAGFLHRRAIDQSEPDLLVVLGQVDPHDRQQRDT
jgi:hypothetical protein